MLIPNQLSSVALIVRGVRVVTFLLCLVASTLSAFAFSPSQPLRVTVRASGQCDSNTIRLRDVAEVSGTGGRIEQLRELVLGPSPNETQSDRWTKEEIWAQLTLQGFSNAEVLLTGAVACDVKRAPPKVAQRTEFHPTSAQPNSHILAQRNVEQAIIAYLQAQVDSKTLWKVQVTLPAEHIKTLNQKRSILGVAGGTSPWEGNQTFRLLLQSPQGESEIAIQAMVAAPPLVAAAVGPLRPGHVLLEKDIQYLPLTSSAKLEASDCYLDAREAIGKELRKAVANGQVIAKRDLGAPRVVSAGDLVEVEVLAGSVTVQTSGKCLQPGGIGDTISIEVLPQKKKIMAQIVADRKVQVSSNSPR